MVGQQTRKSSNIVYYEGLNQWLSTFFGATAPFEISTLIERPRPPSNILVFNTW